MRYRMYYVSRWKQMTRQDFAFNVNSGTVVITVTGGSWVQGYSQFSIRNTLLHQMRREVMTKKAYTNGDKFHLMGLQHMQRTP